MTPFLRPSNVLLPLAVATLLVGCATQPPRAVAPDAMASIKRLGVVSVVADRLARSYTGLTVFGNEYDDIDIASWQLDEQYEEQLGTALADKRSITYVKAVPPRDRFAPANKLERAFASHNQDWEAVAPAVLDYCRANSLDAVMVLTKGETPQQMASSTSQQMMGLGVYARSAPPVPWNTNSSIVYMVGKLGLVDCKSGKALAERRVVIDDSDMSAFLDHLSTLPIRPISTEISRTPSGSWSEATRAQLRAELLTLPKPAWPTTINALFAAKP